MEARELVNQLLERDHSQSLVKSLFARSLRLFKDGYTPDQIEAVVKRHGPLPKQFMATINVAWDEFRRRGVA